MLNKIIEIHNTLCEISVKGEDTLKMGKCLLFLREIATQLSEQREEEQNGIQQTLSTDNR